MQSQQLILNKLLPLNNALPVVTVDNKINNGYIGLAKTCRYSRDKLLTPSFYLSAYEIRLVQYMHDDIDSNEEWYDKGDLFLKSMENHIVKATAIGVSFIKSIGDGRVAPDAGAVVSLLITLPIPFIVSCFTGCVHGLSNMITRPYQTNEELENMNNVYFVINELSSDDTQDEVIANIVCDYRKYKAKQRFQNTEEENNNTQYFFATSDSSMDLLNQLENNQVTRLNKLSAIKKYMNEDRDEKAFSNNGKALFNIIFNELKKICPQTIKNIHTIKKTNTNRQSV